MTVDDKTLESIRRTFTDSGAKPLHLLDENNVALCRRIELRGIPATYPHASALTTLFSMQDASDQGRHAMKCFVFGPVRDVSSVVVFIEGPAALDAVRIKPSGSGDFHRMIGLRSERVSRGKTQSFPIELPPGTETVSLDTSGPGRVVSLYLHRREA